MTTRLRKTFRYPSEEADSDGSLDELDEQEQETLIAELAAHDQLNTLFYRRAFVALPLLAALIYLPVLLTASSSRHVFLALLSLTSLGSTAYILFFLQPVLPQRQGTPYKGDGRGPLEKAMPWLNAALSGVLALAATLAWRKHLVDEAWRGFLPAAIFLVAMYARSQMAPLDVASLERLKYNYKGA